MRLYIAVLIGLLALLVGSAIQGTLTTGAPRERVFDLTYEAEIQNVPRGAGRIEIWIPYPQDDAHQEILAARVDAPSRWTIQTDPEYGNKVLHLTAGDPRARTVPIRMEFRVRRKEHLQQFAGTHRPSRVAERWLEPDRLVPLDERIRALAAEVTAGKRTQREKARAIYDYVVETMTYDKSGTGWGHGDIYWACDVKRGNCTDFHALFIGLNRAVGIPATFEIGFPLPPDRTSGVVDGYHCWAQFYLDGIGWVPVDTSEASKHPEKKEYFFGALDEHRVLFTIGRDIVLAPPQDGEPLNYFIYPYAEIDGQPFDQIQQRFRFRDVSHSAASSDVAATP